MHHNITPKEFVCFPECLTMRRSAGMGGGNILRAAGRAVGGGGVKDVVAAATSGRPAATATAVVKPGKRVGCTAASSSSSSSSNGAKSPTSCSPPTSSSLVAMGWEDVGGEEESELVDDVNWLSDRMLFGLSPSKKEVKEAFSTLQRIAVPVTSSQDVSGVNAVESGSSSEKSQESECDWIEPDMNFYSSLSLQHNVGGKVHYAFRLLQINPSIQRMVVSLSSDKAVWKAVMQNEVVQELKKSLFEDNEEDDGTEKKDEHPDKPCGIFKWVFKKITELADKIMTLVNGISHSDEKCEKNGMFDDLVASSFMLSVMVFIIVVVTRHHKA